MNGYDDYKQDLVRALWSYRDERFGDAAHLFDGRPRSPDRPPVLREEEADRNVLVPPGADDRLRGLIAGAIPRAKRHRWFHDMMSSQALAQSVFANLRYLGKADLLADIMGEDGEPIFRGPGGRPAPIELEVPVTFLGEYSGARTHLDLLVGSDYRVAVECKLSEPEVGTCSRPREPAGTPKHCNGTYSRQQGRRERCVLLEAGILYWRCAPGIFVWDAAADHDPCPMRDTYHLARTVLGACARPSPRDPDRPALDPARGHAVLLHDARNPSFQPGGVGRAAWDAVRRGLVDPSRLRRFTWQALVERLEADRDAGWLARELRIKYGF